MTLGCGSYCEHGGICVLPKGHVGLHDSRYCKWDDAHALTESEADDLLAQSGRGKQYLDFKNTVGAALFGDEPL